MFKGNVCIEFTDYRRGLWVSEIESEHPDDAEAAAGYNGALKVTAHYCDDSHNEEFGSPVAGATIYAN